MLYDTKAKKHGCPRFFSLKTSENLSVGWSSKVAKLYHELRLYDDGEFGYESVDYYESSRHSRKMSCKQIGTYTCKKGKLTLQGKDEFAKKPFPHSKVQTPSLRQVCIIDDKGVHMEGLHAVLEEKDASKIRQERPEFYTHAEGSY